MKSSVTKNTVGKTTYYHREKPCHNSGIHGHRVFHQLWAFCGDVLMFMDCWWS